MKASLTSGDFSHEDLIQCFMHSRSSTFFPKFWFHSRFGFPLYLSRNMVNSLKQVFLFIEKIYSGDEFTGSFAREFDFLFEYTGRSRGLHSTPDCPDFLLSSVFHDESKRVLSWLSANEGTSIITKGDALFMEALELTKENSNYLLFHSLNLD